MPRPSPASLGRGRRFPKPHHRKPLAEPAATTTTPTYTRTTVAAISNLLRYATWDAARAQLPQLPVRWDSYTVARVLKSHPPMAKAWLFFNWAATSLPGFKHDHFTYTTMLDIFGEAGRIASMMRVFRDMEEKGVRIDAATYTSLLHWLGKAGDLDGAVRAWGEMRRRGCRPTVVSYTAFVKVLFDHGRPKEATGVYTEMLEVGLRPTCHTYTVLMEHLAGIGKFESVLEVMSKMQEAGVLPDKAACNILVHKCSRAGEISAMTEILQYMKENKIVLRHPIFLEALDALKSSGESDCLLREVNPHLSSEGIEEEVSDFEPTAIDIASLADRGIVLDLLARRNLIAIECMLCEASDRSICFDSMLISDVIQANCVNYRSSGALMAFHYCVHRRQSLDRSAYIALLGLLIRTNSFQMVSEIVEEMIKAGVCLGTYLTSVLICRLSSAGFSSFATKIFYSLPAEHNTVTYTALMDAYFQAGEVDKGLELYLEMRKQRVLASTAMYQVLIIGLENAGRTHEADSYRKEKRRLQWNNLSRELKSPEESLCDHLFDRI